MKKILTGLILGAVMIAGMAQPVWADGSLCDDFRDDPELFEAAGCNETNTLDKTANNIINIVLSLIGILAVGVIIYGGITYVTSTGEPQKAQKAKNIIMYGVIGLVVALLAYAVVNFVIKSVASS